MMTAESATSLQPARFKDRYGLPLTAGSAAAVTCFDQAYERFLERGGGSDVFARQALERDENFAFAWLLLGIHQRTVGDTAAAAASLRRVTELAPGLSERERSVLHTLEQINAAPPDLAEATIATHLQAWPGDRFVIAQTVYFYAMRDWRPDRIERQVALYEALHDKLGNDWLLLGELSFAYGERRAFDRARDFADRALAANPQNASAAHAHAHVLLETGQADRGAEWIAAWLAAWRNPGASYQCHLTWHLALCELVAERSETAAARLDGLIASLPFGALTDGASLAWRLHLQGHDMREAGRRLVTVPDQGRAPFAMAHKAMALALAGEFAALEQLACEWQAEAPAGAPDTAALVRGVAACAEADWGQAAARLEALAPAFHDFGGSHAQSEVFDDTLIAALHAGGRKEEAMARLQARIARHGFARDRRWLARLQLTIGGRHA